MRSTEPNQYLGKYCLVELDADNSDLDQISSDMQALNCKQSDQPSKGIREKSQLGSAHHKQMAEGGASDRKVKKLHPEALRIYKLANEHYVNSGRNKYDRIVVHSGRRSVSHQTALYEKYIAHLYGGPAANKANQPGTSNHEYGVAVDIVRRDDAELLFESLTKHGWEQTVEDEGWHFDATGIPSWSKIQSRVEKIKKRGNSALVKNVVDRYELQKKVKIEIEKISKMEKLVNRLEIRLVREEKRYMDASTEVEKAKKIVLEIQKRINRTKREIERLLSNLKNIIYDGCPNNRPFQDCSHEDEKKIFVNKLNRIRNNINSKSRVLDELRENVRFIEGDIRVEKKLLRLTIRQIKKSNFEIERAKLKLTKSLEKKENWEGKIDLAQKNLPNLVGDLQKLVDAI